MNLSMAIGVQKNPVFSFVAATFGSFHEMMVMPSGLLADLLVADWALPVLFLPQIKQLAFTREGLVHLSAKTLF